MSKLRKKEKKIWRKSRINDDWSMTRIEGKAIAVRKLTWWEKILLKLDLLK